MRGWSGSAVSWAPESTSHTARLRGASGLVGLMRLETVFSGIPLFLNHFSTCPGVRIEQAESRRYVREP
ncbi:hypothetical protein JOD62_000005 [Microbacterium keratanolyticum]|nr:hypothetical protein [Microbacterium keratanolyticum]